MQAVSQCVFGGVPGQSANFGVVAAKTEHFGVFGAQAVFFGDEFHIGLHQFLDQVKGVADTDLCAGPDIHHLADGVVGSGQVDKSLAGVQHIVEIPCGRNIPQLNLFFSGGDLGDNGGDHGPGALAGAIGVERPGNGHGQAECQMKAQGHLVRPDLACRIWRLGLQRMFLVDRDVLGRAVNFGGGGVDHAFALVFPGGLADIESAFDVGVHIGVRRDIRIGYGNQGRQMENHIDIFGDFLAEMGVPDIPAYHIQFFPAFYNFQPSPVVKGVVHA